ncbi:MAG: FAD-dependent oxidoreductase, partial [Anaerolineae bacterium]
RGALSIDRYLRGQPLLTPRELIPLPAAKLTEEEIQTKLERGEAARHGRVQMPVLRPEERVADFREVELGLTEEQALAEAERCLQCGLCSECYLCVLACKAHAIDHQQAPVERELRVGAVLLAPGYAPYDAQRAPELGWGRYANVLTSLQFERMLSASGPTRGHLARPSDGQEPRRIAFLQCVGSRDQEHDYCSSVCCMYATKEAMLALEHAPGVECTIFQMDMRAFSKGFDAYYQRARDLGVRYVRNRISALKEDPRTRNLILQHTDGDGHTQEEAFDLVVLSVGMEPPTEGAALATQMGIRLDRAGFCQGDAALPVATSRPGIFACGTFAGPKDIPETVVEASAAAGAALAEIGPSRGTLMEPRAYPPEREVTPAEEPRIGVFVCSCGNNIAGVVDVAQVVAYAQTLPGVVHAENTTYSCSPDALLKIQEAIREKRLNRLVVASCTPRTHEPLFRDTARQAGLNPFLFEMANIRDQDSWVHPHEPERATEKAKDLVRAAVARSRLLAPLHTRPQALHH